MEENDAIQDNLLNENELGLNAERSESRDTIETLDSEAKEVDMSDSIDTDQVIEANTLTHAAHKVRTGNWATIKMRAFFRASFLGEVQFRDKNIL